MMYPFMTLEDSTEIVHSEILDDKGKEIVTVYIKSQQKAVFYPLNVICLNISGK